MDFEGFIRPSRALYGPQGPYEALKGPIRPLRALKRPQGPYKALKNLRSMATMVYERGF